MHARLPPLRPKPGGVALATAASSHDSSSSSSDQHSFAERARALKAELGEGEGVSALLARSRALGLAGVVVASEEEEQLSVSALLEQPSTPVTQLRRDTYGASLHFLEALCVASANLMQVLPVSVIGMPLACANMLHVVSVGVHVYGVRVLGCA